jgi:hypothetical protein
VSVELTPITLYRIRLANSKAPKDDLTPAMRAEDILLGSLGYGEDAKVVTIERTDTGYKGVGIWQDGEEFLFESDDELDELQIWALEILLQSRASL